MNSKNTLIVLLLLALSLSVYTYARTASDRAKNSKVDVPLKYYIQHRPEKSTSPDALKKAESLADIIDYFPGSWIMEYDSVGIFTTSEGRQKKAFGKSEKLTQNQKEILETADMFSVIDIYVKYKSQNTVTKELDAGEMNVKLTVQPKTQAKYPGGMEALIDYLKENSEKEVAQLSDKEGFVAIVNFTISPDGSPADVEVAESSDYKGIDQLLKKTIEEMPTWTPALDAEGQKAEQKFEFVFGFGREGGC